MLSDGEPEDEARVRSTYARYDVDGRTRLWDRSNRGFDRLKRDVKSRLVQLLEKSTIGREAKLLDVGCGEGDLEVLAGSHGIEGQWTGIDLLEASVDRARRRRPDVTWVVGSATSLPFESDSFDVAAAITLFSSLPTEDVEELVAREIARLLRPGGWLIWHDLRIDNPFNEDVHGLSYSRIRELFPGWDLDLHAYTLAPPIARRLGRATPILYPLLHSIPPLRSHLIGRLRCPT